MILPPGTIVFYAVDPGEQAGSPPSPQPSPPVSPYPPGGNPPVSPPPGSPPPPPPGPVPIGGAQTWAVLVNCKLQDIAAVVSPTAADLQIYAGEGWNHYPSYDPPYPMTQDQVSGWLQNWIPSAQALCGIAPWPGQPLPPAAPPAASPPAPVPPPPPQPFPGTLPPVPLAPPSPPVRFPGGGSTTGTAPFSA